MFCFDSGKVVVLVTPPHLKQTLSLCNLRVGEEEKMIFASRKCAIFYADCKGRMTTTTTTAAARNPPGGKCKEGVKEEDAFLLHKMQLSAQSWSNKVN